MIISLSRTDALHTTASGFVKWVDANDGLIDGHCAVVLAKTVETFSFAKKSADFNNVMHMFRCEGVVVADRIVHLSSEFQGTEMAWCNSGFKDGI